MGKSVLERNNVKISGEGTQPMLFVNGYGCDMSIWRFVIPEFEDSYKIIRFDHVGSGESDHSAYEHSKYDSLQGYANDIVEICRELKLKDTIIIGHSVGCIISMLAVIKAPEYFEKTVLVSPSPCYINDGGYHGGFSREDIDELIDALESNYLGWVSYISPVITGNVDKPEFAEEISNRFCRNNPEIAKHFAKVTFLGDNRNDLPKLQRQSLIIQVSEDIVAPMEVGQYMHKMIPQNRLKVIEGNGHCPHLTHPVETIQAIKGFVKHTASQIS